MAVIRDMMPAFELFQPASIDEALNLLDRHGSEAWVMAGGLDTFDWLKDRTKRPSVVVDLSQIQARAHGQGEATHEAGAIQSGCAGDEHASASQELASNLRGGVVRAIHLFLGGLMRVVECRADDLPWEARQLGLLLLGAEHDHREPVVAQRRIRDAPLKESIGDCV